MATRSKYQCLTLKRKLEIIDEVEQSPRKNIVSEFGIPQSTLKHYSDKLRASYVAGRSKRKRCREPTRPEVDAALFQWFTATREQSVPISGEILKVRAEEFSKEFGEPDWVCSSGWLSRWKVRHNVAYRRISGENATVDKNVCEDLKQRILKPVLSRYDRI